MNGLIHRAAVEQWRRIRPAMEALDEASKLDPRFMKYESEKTLLFNERDAELVSLREKARISK